MVHPVLIVGGGTSGWMSASYPKATFGDKVDGTPVKSNRVGTIGVGEATFGTIRHFLDFLGLDETEWIPAASDASKHGIRFENRRGDGTRLHHPFERPRVSDGFHLADWWLQFGDKSKSFDQECSLTAEAAEPVKALPGTREYLTGLRERQDRAPGSAPTP
ncbi:tryptophan 7-halogenase [Streptomyces sp. NPDC051658]|uniref:tryptophan 7-halogenase n=1 Tax=Streptomyces sp. NPDC051658 TaxID=3365667 RepID=UPI00379E8023